jgi:hypothetical protein
MLISFEFPRRRPCVTLCITLALAVSNGVTFAPAIASNIGYRDFSYGSSPNTPAADKPQNKLWWNDGKWWAGLYNTAAAAFHIYRLDPSTQTWIDTGTTIDNRPDSHLDTLWDGQHLLIVAGSLSHDALLYRFSYSSSVTAYSLDFGFPVSVRSGGSQSIAITRDSTGQLWVTFTQGEQVWVNCSLGADNIWHGAFMPSLAGTDVTSDDISGIIAVPESATVGMMWSNQDDKKFYFSVHRDGDPPTAWQPSEIALPGPGENASYPWADNHINLKTLNGKVYAAVKTSLDALTDTSLPLNMLLVRDMTGAWSNYPFGRVSDGHTRPIVVLDQDHGNAYMMATAPQVGGSIYYKMTPLDNIQFPLGRGAPILRSSTDTDINNVTSTRQNLTSTTGLAVLAGDNESHHYLHNLLSLGSAPPGLTTLSPTDDAYVRDGSSANSNFGAAHTLFAKTSTASGYNRDSYIKFDTSSADGTVTSATLRIWAALTGSGSVATTAYSVADTSWTEAGITWNNKPSRGAALSSATVAGATFAWYTLDVTAYVQSERAAGRNVIGLALHNVAATDPVVQANSREAANGPQLVVSTQ